MSVVANIAINVDSTKAISQLNAVDRAASGLSGSTGKLQQAFGGLNTALASLGLGVLIKDLAGVGIDADRTGKRIQGLAGASGETGKVLAIASKAAKEFGLSSLEAEKGMADLYGRLRPAGVALKDIETVYNGVNKAALAAGLTNADTSGVFLQLSQALGSGALQGDELRSIMERMPAVGQAVAKVMGVTVGQVKQLGADGKITTDIMIKAAAELNKLAPPPPDPFKVFNAELENLRVELGENILPILTPFVQLLLGIVKAFGAMPEPLQTAIVAIGLVVTAIIGIGSAVAFLAPVIAGFKTFAVVIGAANIGGIIAGWLPVIVKGLAGIVGAVKAAGALILSVFSGPVGWTVLAVAAVVAMVVLFREPIMKFFTWLGGAISTAFSGLMKLIYPIFVQPFIDLWNNVLRGPVTTMFSWIGGYIEFSMKTAYALAYQVFVQPWINVWNTLKGPVTNFFNWIGGVVKAGMDAALKLAYAVWIKPWIDLWNKVLRDPVTAGIKWIQETWKGISKFFTDNVTTPISKAWTAMVEFLPKAMDTIGKKVQGIFTGVVNTVKGALRSVLQFIANAVNSVGAQVNKLIGAFNRLPGPDIPMVPTLNVPAFAEGGVVDRPTLAMVGEGGEREYIIPESKMAAAASNYLAGGRGAGIIKGSSNTPVINITTGPVMQQGEQQYVTVADMQAAVQNTAKAIYASLRTPAGRYATGIR